MVTAGAAVNLLRTQEPPAYLGRYGDEDGFLSNLGIRHIMTRCSGAAVTEALTAAFSVSESLSLFSLPL